MIAEWEKVKGNAGDSCERKAHNSNQRQRSLGLTYMVYGTARLTGSAEPLSLLEPWGENIFPLLSGNKCTSRTYRFPRFCSYWDSRADWMFPALEHFEKRLEQFSGPISSYLQEHEEVWGGSRGREEMWVAPASEREGKRRAGQV